MISFLTEILTNSDLSETVQLYWNHIISSITSIIFLVENQTIVAYYEYLVLSLNFDEFQSKLLKGFSLILLINIILTYVAWQVYGKRICERFMKPSTSKAIEELKASVSKLKLPKEHTPRI